MKALLLARKIKTQSGNKLTQLHRSGTHAPDFMFSLAGTIFVLLSLFGSVWWASKQESLDAGK